MKNLRRFFFGTIRKKALFIFGLFFVAIAYFFVSHLFESKKTKENISVTLDAVRSSSVDLTAANMKAQAADFIKELAINRALGVENFLQNNPKMTIADLQKSKQFRAIAIRSVGKTGYTAIHNDGGINYFHTNPNVENTDLRALAAKLPAFWAIVEKSLAGDAEGYYDWEDADGKIRQKYMYIKTVDAPTADGKHLRVAATTYLDEFFQPIDVLKERLNSELGKSEKELELEISHYTLDILVVIFILTLFMGAVFLFLLLRILAPIRKMSEVTDEIAEGNFEKKLNDDSDDEIGRLSRSINSMGESLAEKQKELEERIAERTKEVSSAHADLEKTYSALLNISEDIKEAKENVEEQVQERTRELSEEHGKMAALLESVHLGVFMTDLSFNILMANPAAKEMFGKKKEEILDFKDVKKSAENIEWQRALSYHPERGAEIKVQEAKIKDRYYKFFMSPVIDLTSKNIIGAVIVVEDVTSERLVEQMRKEIVAITSHQLRTPLSVIKGNIEMILSGDYGKLKPDQQEVLGEALKGNERMIRLVNDLMDVNKITEGRLGLKLEPLGVDGIIAEVAEMESGVAKNNSIKFEYKAPAKALPKIMLDAIRIRQVFQNLIDNAIKYTPHDGKGRVAVKLEKSGEDAAIFTVSDNGAGIPADEQEKIFERFFRASNASRIDPGGGTGLGLFIAKSITEFHDGKLWFESVEGKGTTFYVTLPFAKKK